MDFFMLDAGTSTVSCLALFALRMRVSISAMGSVICMMFPSLLELRAYARISGKVSELGNSDLLSAGIVGARSASFRPVRAGHPLHPCSFSPCRTRCAAAGGFAKGNGDSFKTSGRRAGAYQLAFFTPGICPLYASSRKQIRQMP